MDQIPSSANPQASRSSDAVTPTPGPAVVLVDPQLGENVGATARAMLNCSLTDLRLVRPRDGWPNRRAAAAAVGATAVLDQARVFDRVEEAIADLTHVYAATARSRYMLKGVVTPRQAGREMQRFQAAGESSGVLFGPERSGLTNETVVLASKVLQVPANPRFSSLNLSHAVLLVAYEWYQACIREPHDSEPAREKAATSGQLQNFFQHLEQELDAADFFRVEEKRPAMVRNLRNLFHRAHLREHEVQTLHGVVAVLAGRRKDGRPVRKPGHK